MLKFLKSLIAHLFAPKPRPGWVQPRQDEYPFFDERSPYSERALEKRQKQGK